MASVCRKPCSLKFITCRNVVTRRSINSTKVLLNQTSDQSKFTSILENERVQKWMTTYEEFVGLTEVKHAQDKVYEAEMKFLDVQEMRRKKQQVLTDVQSRLTEIRAELEKVQRGEERYIALLTKEHGILQEEKQLVNELKHNEELERTYFSSLQSAFRESHEKERTRTERTKYWSLSASIIGVVLGAFGTSLNNHLRMRELKRMVREQGKEGGETKELLGKLLEKVAAEQNTIRSFVFDVKTAMGQKVEDSKESPIEMKADPLNSLEVISQNYQTLQADMKDVKEVLQKAKVFDKDDNVIYVGTEIKDALETTEKNIGLGIKDALETTENNIEAKMKLNALYTVTFMCGAIALAAVYGLFKGP